MAARYKEAGYLPVSQVWAGGRPPFLPASEAICRGRSGKSLSARALPPMRAKSVIVIRFFIAAIHHAAGMQAADIHITVRPFSLTVASTLHEWKGLAWHVRVNAQDRE